MTTTPLDTAFATMEEVGTDAARLRFYDRLAGTELFLLLTAEPEGEAISPEIFETDGVSYVLAFDLEDRLSAFTGRAVPYAALSGRALAGMLAQQGFGLALNLEQGPAQTLLPPDALRWLVDTLGTGPETSEAQPESLAPPQVPETLVTALDEKLAGAAGLARHAYLAGVVYKGGGRGHLLGITGAAPGAEAALAGAVNETLVFSGLEAGVLDVTFLADSDPLAASLARVALRFDLPEPEAPKVELERPAPGSDPEKPPKLR